MSAMASDMTKKLVTDRSRLKQTTAVTTRALPENKVENDIDYLNNELNLLLV